MAKLSCVLLVDDSDADNFLHRIVLEESGCAERVETAGHGGEALAYLRRAHAGEAVLPDLIFLDINMPVIGGWEFLERGLAEGLLDERSAVVAMLSTSGRATEQARAREFDLVASYLVKPLDSEGLGRLLRERFPQLTAS